MISLSTNGNYLFVGMYYGIVKAFGIEEGSEVLSWHLYPVIRKNIKTDINSICLLPGEKIFYTGGTDGQVMEMLIKM